MANEGVFPNPTVKIVVFQIKYPHLFSIEKRIAEFQEKIIEKFPQSSLSFRRQILFADVGPKGKLTDIEDQLPEDFARKIWQFRSENNYEVNVMTNSLDITSNFHKTYKNPDGDEKFRDIIEFVLNKFFEIISIPIINRIGLRYIDECPLPSKNNEILTSYYNTTFPIQHYPLNEADEMFFRTVTKRGEHNLIYQERLEKKNGEYKLILDFDGYATKIPSKDFLEVTDELHDIISKEYFSIIKEPVKEYMRQRNDNNDRESKEENR